MNTSRHAAIEDGMGAKLTMNGDTYDVPKSSPKVPFFAKNVLPEYALRIFGNLVMSQRRGTVPCFFDAGSSQNCQNSMKTAFSSTKRIGNLT